MKLEPIIQSEVSQKEKHQCSILMHMYGLQKDGNNNPICKTAKETHVPYCSLKHCLQQLGYGSNLDVHWQTNG